MTGGDEVTWLVPRPLSDDYTSRTFNRVMRDEPAPDEPEETIELWGHCADFCESSDSERTNGLAVGEHGLWCRSLSTASVDGKDEHGERAYVAAQAAEPYHHGTYRREDVYGNIGGATVHLVLAGEGIAPDSDEHEGNDARYLVLSVGDAYRLAAGLVKAAEVADRRDRDFNGAKRRRETDQ